MVKLLHITLGTSRFGFNVRNATIVNAPPIAKWAEGKSLDKVISYYKAKNAEIYIQENGKWSEVK